eukprot:6173311-Pleurochrysis_carterae.AAC.1
MLCALIRRDGCHATSTFPSKYFGASRALRSVGLRLATPYVYAIQSRPTDGVPTLVQNPPKSAGRLRHGEPELRAAVC